MLRALARKERGGQFQNVAVQDDAPSGDAFLSRLEGEWCTRYQLGN